MTTGAEASGGSAGATWSNQGPLVAADRGLFYGDGLFETIRLIDGKPRLLTRHLKRLQRSAEAFQLPLPQHIETDIARGLAESRVRAGVIKVVVSRQATSRGYAPDPDAASNALILIYADPLESVASQGDLTLGLCATRLARQPALAGHKHLNRLEQVLARREWQDPAIADGVMLDTEGLVIETTSSNLFVCLDGRWMTPDLTRCGVAGVMREWVLEVAEQLGVVVSVCDISREELNRAEAVFLTNAVAGVRGVGRYLDGLSLAQTTERGCSYVNSAFVEQLSMQLQALSDSGGE